MIGYQDRGGAVDAVVDAARSAEAFVYAYWDGIDRTAHEYGFGERYDEELAACDAMVAAMLDRLAPDTALLVTADHGQVEVGERMVTLPDEVSALVDRQSGEARFRWLHGHPGSETDLLAASQEAFGTSAWVVGVDEAVNSGWFGPVVTPAARARLGDVALVAREQVGFVDPAEVIPIQLICRHGSLTADETLVPLVGVVT
jgi:predicted AlkP superfamily pyrophosphatase or phosphodiesterase